MIIVLLPDVGKCGIERELTEEEDESPVEH